jgi:hypothetical protein
LKRVLFVIDHDVIVSFSIGPHSNARLMIVVLPADDERQAWSQFSASQLAKAYGDNEPEYTAADLRP